MLADDIDIPELRAHLAPRLLTQLDLARRLNVPASTFCGWLRGATAPPSDLPQRIENALDLPPRALAKKPESANNFGADATTPRARSANRVRRG
jgi:transcriptional regulator with XRE-family HTH domain